MSKIKNDGLDQYGKMGGERVKLSHCGHWGRPYGITLLSWLRTAGRCVIQGQPSITAHRFIVLQLHRVMELTLLLGIRTLVTACLLCSSVWTDISLNGWQRVVQKCSQVKWNVQHSNVYSFKIYSYKYTQRCLLFIQLFQNFLVSNPSSMPTLKQSMTDDVLEIRLSKIFICCNEL